MKKLYCSSVFINRPNPNSECNRYIALSLVQLFCGDLSAASSEISPRKLTRRMERNIRPAITWFSDPIYNYSLELIRSARLCCFFNELSWATTQVLLKDAMPLPSDSIPVERLAGPSFHHGPEGKVLRRCFLPLLKR